MDELTWLQQRESILPHTSSLKGVLIVATKIFRSRHKNKLNREKRGRDITLNSRQKSQHKCKEVMSRNNKLGRESTSQLNIKMSCRDRENGSRHKDRLKANKLCRDQKN